MVLSHLVTLRPRRVASSSEIKLCVASVSSIARMPLVVDEQTHVYEPFPCMCRQLTHKCAKALEQTHVELGFLHNRCVAFAMSHGH